MPGVDAPGGYGGRLLCLVATCQVFGANVVSLVKLDDPSPVGTLKPSRDMAEGYDRLDLDVFIMNLSSCYLE